MPLHRYIKEEPSEGNPYLTMTQNLTKIKNEQKQSSMKTRDYRNKSVNSSSKKSQVTD